MNKTKKNQEQKLRKIFVYGTLKRGMYNSRFLPNSVIKKMEKVTTRGTLYYISSGSFPCLKLEGDNTIHGEVYTIHEKHWDRILEDVDCLEGCPTLYTRQIIKVKNKHGKEFEAWGYIFNGDYMLGREIKDGVFKGPDPYAYRNFQQSLYDYYYGDF